MPTFQFNGFILRPAGWDDIALLRNWLGSDPYHAGVSAASFWIENSAIANSFLLLDSVGEVFFFKIVRLSIKSKRRGFPSERAVALHIQFAPNDERGRKLRTLQGLAIGWDWLKKILASQGYDAVYFTSKNRSLMQFCCARLEFVEDGVEGDETRLKAYLVRGDEIETL